MVAHPLAGSVVLSTPNPDWSDTLIAETYVEAEHTLGEALASTDCGDGENPYFCPQVCSGLWANALYFLYMAFARLNST